MSVYRLEMRKITKSYGGVRALHNVDFQLKEGEIHALVGENGAGKSTLIKILGGAVQKDSGEILLEDYPVDIFNPAIAHQHGIRVIYQELILSPGLSVAENIFAGRYPTIYRVFLDRKRMYREADNLLHPFNLQLDLKKSVGELSVAQQQLVEIAKALSRKAKILVMDEPSAVLTPTELEHLFKLVRRLKEQNVSIIYISHRLEEIFELADRVTVLRDGMVIDCKEKKELDKPALIRMMVGRSLGQDYPPRRNQFGPDVLEVSNLSRKNILKDISFHLRKGEILGIAGLVGAGRTELAQVLFGATSFDKGTIKINGSYKNINKPKSAIKSNIAFAPEDRKKQGLLLNMPIASNITITYLKRLLRMGFISTRLENQITQGIVNQLDIRTSSIALSAGQLSGGNQQKVVLGKWLNTNAKIFLLDEPTRGIDVGAKAQIYALLDKLVREGAAILMISSELPEILGMSDRILVMHEGKITGEFTGGKATEEEILTCATGN